MHTEIETDTATDVETISSAVKKTNGETGQRELNRTYGYTTIEHTLRKQARWRTARSAFRYIYIYIYICRALDYVLCVDLVH